MPRDVLIETRALTKRYGDRTVVDRLDLQVAAGEVYGLLGPNGAGKTTTILMLLGLSEPSGGQARVAGLDPTRDPIGVKSIVGYLPDNVGFYERLTGRENLTYTARLNRVAPSETGRRIEAVLEEVGLTAAADDPVGTYSRGMRQRLGIAAVRVKQPAVAVLDEPTIAIDPEGVLEIQVLIRRMADSGTAVLLSSHLLHQMQSVCDRVGIFVAGRLIASGTREELATAAGGFVYELRVDDPGSAVTEAASARGAEATRHLDHWEVRAADDIGPDLLRDLVERGVIVRDFRSVAADLDEVYRSYFREEASA